ncbi:MAG: glycosyltransferase family 39 protein [Acidobacteria bacterium]|nr:glycosyltransferase family 39 protein [Acidobacteriota bacterium]
MKKIDRKWWLYPGVCLGAIWLGRWVLQSPDVAIAILTGLVTALCCLAIVARQPEEQKFLVRLFVAALTLRWLLGMLIHSNPILSYLGADASTYDAFGNVLCRSWQGLVDSNDPWLVRATSANLSGWGMLYYVAAIYYIVGQNPLAVQLVTAAFGASSVIIIYRVVLLLFDQPRIARTAAIMIAFSPSMILWSSQALKDGPIVFCLAVCALYTLRLREKFSLKNLFLLGLFLFCLYSLRHYAFYILFFSIAGGLLIGAKNFSPIRILQGGLLVVILGTTFVYFGAKDVAEKSFSLKDIQARREYGAKEAKSGYGGDVDITDTKAAITFLPIGVAYVLLSPFPWMIGLRQLVIVPELVLWWLALPLLIKGYWYAIRHRLKESFVICLFTVGLTLVYALYQTNVGTAYRHRAQMYIFFFIFISVGWEMRRSTKMLKLAEKARWYEELRNRAAMNPSATTPRMTN